MKNCRCHLMDNSCEIHFIDKQGVKMDRTPRKPALDDTKLMQTYKAVGERRDMIKDASKVERRECKCACHNDLGSSIMHVTPCCYNELNESVKQPKLNSVGINDATPEGRAAIIVWNAAIEAAAIRTIEIEETEHSYLVEQIRKLKK